MPDAPKAATLDSFGTFGELLKHLRRRARLTLKELGIAVGYSEAHVARLENGQRVPDLTTVRTLLIPALGLDKEPLLAARVVELAEAAHGEREASPTGSGVAAKPLTNLPAQLTHFVGREQEMGEVAALLATTRLLTLTGSGGCGKTRLAIEVGAWSVAAQFVAAQHAAPLRAFSGGVWLVELAPLTEPALVADTVASTFALTTGSRRALDVLVEYLAHRHLFLILDNCEHLILACAELAGALLGACPQVHILATSREPLNIPGEVTWRVPSLATDEAMQLFAERGRAAKPDFSVTSTNTAVVSQICQRLDGMPLALELAAARLRAFSVEQIATRLDHTFHLLSGGSRIALPRQQTLRATIDWSYDLLPEQERNLLRELSAFAGGWTLEAAEAIHGPDTADLLEQLVFKSLVEVEERPTGIRYRMLETIRQYAHERLIEAGEYEQVHQEHLEYFAGLAQSAKPYLHSPEQVVWLDRLEVELDNLRAALDWSAQTKDVRRCGHLIDGLWWMWYMRDYCVEGRKWIETVLPAELTGSGPARAAARIASGELAMRIGLYTLARADLTEALAVAQQLQDTYLILQAELGLGWVHPDDGQAVHLLEEAMRLARENGLKSEESWALNRLGSRAQWRGDNQQAASLFSKALAGFREVGDTLWIAVMLDKFGQLAIQNGEYTEAKRVLKESASLARDLKSDIQIADACIDLAIVGLHQGDDAGAMNGVRESIAIYRTVGNLERVGECLSVAAGVAHARGNFRHAATLLGAADQLWRLSESERLQHITVEYNHHLPAVGAVLDPADFDRAWEDGQKMTVKEAIALALTV